MQLKVFSIFLFITSLLADSSTGVNDTSDETEETEMQCDKSLFHAKDLQNIIGFVENSLSIHKKVNDTIQSEAVPIRNKYIRHVNSSIRWFTAKPEHLRDILDEISETRQNIIKVTNAIERSLTTLPNFTSIYQQKLDEKKQLLKTFEFYEQVCKINRGPQKVVFRRAVRDSTSKLYCATFAEVNTTIHERLENFTDKYVQHIHREIINAEQDYNMKIKTRVKDLKKVALEEFKGIMFHILNLQDMYHHHKRELREFNANWQIELEELNINVDTLLLRLKKVVMHFVNNCKTCHSINPNNVEIEERQQVYLQTENIFDLLINNRLNEISKYGNTELSKIFNELDESLKRVNTDHILVTHLTPIQEEIMELTKREINAFNDLRISNVKIDMDLMKELIAKTNELHVAISKKIEEIRINEGEF